MYIMLCILAITINILFYLVSHYETVNNITLYEIVINEHFSDPLDYEERWSTQKGDFKDTFNYFDYH